MIGISSVRNAVSSGVLGAVAISCVAAHGGDARAQEVLAANAGIVGEVIVTGTRRAERTVADSNVPVDVVSTQDLQLTAVADLASKLQGTVPSYNVKRLPLADGAIFVRPAALRGLSPDQTLVLVNGKRRHRSAFVDVTAQGAQAVDLAHIPQIALGRVEVLRDGASAQYGSDAIAGVINLILDDRPGFRSYTQWGEYAEGDGENIQAAAAGGIALGNSGSLNLSLEYVKADATSRSLQRPQAEALIALGEPYASHVHQPVVQRFGQPDLESYRSFYNASFDVGGTVEIYAFGNYARSEGINDFNWRAPAAAGGFAQSSAFNRSIDQDGPDAIFPDWDLRSIYPGGFTPRFGSRQDDYSTVVGVRGDLTPKLSWDASASYGYNKVEYFLHETINASLGPLSPTSFDAGSRDQAETNVNLEFVYEWDTVFAQPVNVAFGAEYRREQFGIQAGEPASYEVGPLRDLSPAANGFPGASPQQAGSWTRSNYALYVDLDADVTARWNVGLAARLEDYDTFGSTADGKLSTRFKLSDALNLRAAVSTGFHAPTPGQANLTNTNQFPDAATQTVVTAGTLPPTSPVALLLGGKELTPEESVNYSVGFVITPAAGFTASVDYYRIKVEDRIGLTPRYTLTQAQRDSLIAAGFPAAADLTQVNFFTNGFSTLTQGVDAVVSFHTALGGGTLGITGAYNYNDTEITRAQPGVISVQTRTRIEELTPKNTATLTTDYRWNAWSVQLRGRYYGSWTEPLGENPAQNQRVGQLTFVDLLLGVALRENIDLTVGFENVLDKYPERALYNTFLGVKYPRQSPYEKDGRHGFVRLGIAF
jgi:iron complex outermembrane receptor protein